MAVTMRDVARRAKVSLATVSYVINQGPRPVSRDLRERVLTAMQELGYRPARRGRTRVRPLTVGAVVPDVSNSFFARALDGLESALSEGGHHLLSASSHEDPARERALVTSLRLARVDGLVLTPCGAVPPEVDRLAAAGTRVVLMDRDGGCDHLPRVVMDNYRSAFQAVRLLIESGHRRIALVNGPEQVSPARERLRGYRAALAFAGAPADEEYVRCGPFTVEHGRRATLDLLGMRHRPQAIFSSSVILTAGVVWALREHGVRWPDEIGLVGFGDDAWAALVTPPLTVIEQPARQLGEVAARLLLTADGSRTDAQQVVLDSRVVLRESHWRAARLEESAS
jgi:DNA-binding LacI/PurR family transcriptional regulator